MSVLKISNLYSRHKVFGRRTLPIIALLFVALGLYIPILIKMSGAYDYIIHMRAALQFYATGDLHSSHFLYQLLISAVYFLTKNIDISYISTLSLCVVATALLIYTYIHNNKANPYTSAAASLALLVVTPIYILFYVDHHQYFGYIGINVYHNPTMILLKPIALILFIKFALSLESPLPTHKNKLSILYFILLIVLSALAKPSFLICFMPAVAFFLLISALKKTYSPWAISCIGVILPAVSILLIQYYLTYADQQLSYYQAKSSIALAPFQFVNHYSSYIFPKFLLSIAFPALIFVLYFSQVRKCRVLLFAWTTFLIGAFQYYFLIETGPRSFQGNFSWGAQITLFILFVVSMRHLMKNSAVITSNKINNIKMITCWTVFSLHTIFGFIFYYSEFLQSEKYW